MQLMVRNPSLVRFLFILGLVHLAAGIVAALFFWNETTIKIALLGFLTLEVCCVVFIFRESSWYE